MGFRIRGKLGPDPTATAQQGAVAVLFVGQSAQSYAPRAPLNTTHTDSSTLSLMATSSQSAGGALTPGDVTTLTLSPALTASAVPVTFGHAFLAGDVPAGVSVEVVGKTTQFEAKTTHPDGSVRHAIITALTNTSAGVPQIVTLRTRAPVSGTAISSADVLASAFSASIALNVGGTVYALAARDLLDGTVTPMQTLTHLSGPQCSEFIVGAKLRNGATPHAHLAAYFHVRAYGSAGNITRVRCDMVVENNWSYVASPRNFTYDATLTVGGATVYTTAALEHFHHARWHKVFWWGGDPQIRAIHNKPYLMATKAAPNLNTSVVPNETTLAAITQSVAPMARGELRDYWPAGGIDQSIGPVPGWTAAYLLSDDVRAHNGLLANADAGGSMSAHARDDGTNGGTVGQPTSIIEHPLAGFADKTGSDFPAQASPSTTPYTLDVAHMPNIAYVPYIVTGDFYYLEETIFWANWPLLSWEGSVNSRNGASGYIQSNQERGQAWALREIAQAAFIVPDTSPFKAYFTTMLANNRTWYVDRYINEVEPGLYKNPFGALDRSVFGTLSGRQETKVWMDDFFTWAMGRLLELGFSTWQSMFDFKAQFVLNRLRNPDYCWIVSGPDSVKLSATATGAWYSTWKQVYDNTWPALVGVGHGSQAMATYLSTLGLGTIVKGEIWSYATLPGSRVAIMHAAMAMLLDRNVAGAKDAWRNLRSSTVLPNWNDYTNGGAAFSVWPRNALPAIPAYITNQAAGSWRALKPSNGFSGALRYSDVYPTYQPPGIGDQSYSGGVYDKYNHRLVVWGGGHNNSQDNTVYGFGPFLDSENPQWVRIVEPSNPVNNNASTSPTNADGKPVSPHSYDQLAYHNELHRLFSMGLGSISNNGNANDSVFACDLNAGAWDAAGTYAAVPAASSQSALAEYDNENGKIWYHGGGSLVWRLYDPYTNTYTTYSDGLNKANAHVSMALNTAGRYAIGIGGIATGNPIDPGTSRIVVWDLTTGTGYQPTINTLPLLDLWGLQYYPPANCFVAWEKGNTIYKITPPANPFTGAWTAVSLSPSGDSHDAANWRGTTGRWQYVPECGVFVGVQGGGIDGNVPGYVYLYKPDF